MTDLLDIANDFSVIGGAAQHSEGHRTDSKRFSEIVNPVQHWVKKEQPTPGAYAYAFETIALPEFGVVGTGIGPSFFFKPFQQPSYQQNKSVPIAGLGGIVAGTVYSQPLYDPSTNTFGGAEFSA